MTSALARLYGHSLALLTDLYQLTMAHGFWKSGMADREAVYHLSFRHHPFGGQYTVAAGLADAIDYLTRLQFTDSDLEYLAGLVGADQQPLLDASFLKYLSTLQFGCDVDAIQEGTVVFPHEPLVRVRGPLVQCQLLETPLLNIINFQTLIATKSSRVCFAARGDMVLEFGLRRAHGVDGGISASRAAMIGGCHATSNVLAGKLFDVPVRGTHAHSWVMAFDTESDAFRAYADSMPNNCIFLVDTYDTLEGVHRAARVGLQLRDRGHELIGVRLDSGDLLQLSIQARQILDEAGLPDASIVASNDLDEYQIDKLKRAGARINVWGVGTRLATAHQQPALDGVYKLSAIRSPHGDWEYKMKLSEQQIKGSDPGILQVRRYCRNDQLIGDILYDEPSGMNPSAEAIDQETGERLSFADAEQATDLLVPVFRDGRKVYNSPTVLESQRHARQQLDMLPQDVKRLDQPQRVAVGRDQRLHELKLSLMKQLQAEKG